MAKPVDVEYRVKFAMAGPEGTTPVRELAEHAERVGNAWIAMARETAEFADATDLLVAASEDAGIQVPAGEASVEDEPAVGNPPFRTHLLLDMERFTVNGHGRRLWVTSFDRGVAVEESELTVDEFEPRPVPLPDADPIGFVLNLVERVQFYRPGWQVVVGLWSNQVAVAACPEGEL